MNLKDLAKPIQKSEVEWRIGRSGKGSNGIWATALAYVSNRAIMHRLDAVCGPENWQNNYREWHGNSQICGLGIYVDHGNCQDDREWVWKWDGADNTNIEATKGGLSDSMKRCGVQWGIGRDLYELDETYVQTSETKQKGWNYAKLKDNTAFYWQTPDLDAIRNGNTAPEPQRATVQAKAPETGTTGQKQAESATDAVKKALSGIELKHMAVKNPVKVTAEMRKNLDQLCLDACGSIPQGIEMFSKFKNDNGEDIYKISSKDLSDKWFAGTWNKAVDYLKGDK